METFSLLAELDEEQRAFHDVLHTLASQLGTDDRIRKDMQSTNGWSPDSWDTLTALGVSGLMVPEALGGSGAGTLELAIAMELAGRHLLCAPLLSTAALATSALSHGAPAVAEKPLRSIASGTTATVAITDGRIPTSASLVDDRWMVTGSKMNVIDGCTAGIVVVSAETDGEPVLLVLDAADAARRTPQDTLDLTRRLACLDFDDVYATLLARGTSARTALEALDQTACIALGAEQLGIAERLLDMTVEYAGARAQFGRAIGSFQAVKHHCANMLIEVELLAAALGHAIRVTNEAERALAAALVQAQASEACVQVANLALQVHGGIGFTWEHPLHLYLKRARSSRQLFGTALQHRQRIARLAGLV